MSYQDKIAADQAAVDQAQAVLNAAEAQLVSDQAAQAAVQPHLALIDQIETELASVEQNMDATMAAALASIKASIAPFLQQMRDLLNA